MVSLLLAERFSREVQVLLVLQAYLKCILKHVLQRFSRVQILPKLHNVRVKTKYALYRLIHVYVYLCTYL